MSVRIDRGGRGASSRQPASCGWDLSPLTPSLFSPFPHAELHELRVKAEKDKADEASLTKSMAKIEADAKSRFEADKAAAAAAEKALGTWVSSGGARRVCSPRPETRNLWDAVWRLPAAPTRSARPYHWRCGGLGSECGGEWTAVKEFRPPRRA